MKDSNQLKKELCQAGASAAEAETLLPIASRLSLLKQAPASESTVNHYAWFRILKPVALAGSGLFVGMFVIILSQAASPTSLLYPVQKFSDSIAVDVHPQFRSTVMMKRAQQVNQLVAAKAGSKQILATLADYTREASAYKTTPHTNYEAFEFCKSNLQQASVAASPAIKQAIASSLQSLETT